MIKRVSFTVWAALALALGIFALGGCAAVSLVDTAARGIFVEEEVNISEKSFAAADFMAHQARSFILEQTIIKATPFGEEYEPNITSAIGNFLPEQIGVRFAQLGYNVDLSEVADKEKPQAFGVSVNNAEHKRRHAGRTPSTMLLTGTYRRTSLDLEVSVRLMDTASGRVVGAMDFALPMNDHVAELAAPRPRIFKIPK